MDKVRINTLIKSEVYNDIKDYSKKDGIEINDLINACLVLGVARYKAQRLRIKNPPPGTHIFP